MILVERWCTLIQKTSDESPSLTEEQLSILRRFASFDAGIDEIRRALSGVFQINLQPELRTAERRFKIPEPGVRITKEHISRALENKRLGLISERDLVYWATMILLNDAYEINPEEEDFIADWLNDISYNLDPT